MHRTAHAQRVFMVKMLPWHTRLSANASAPSSFSFTPIGNLPIGRMGVRQCSTTLVTPPQQKQQGSSESGGAESAARPLLWEVALVNGQHHLTLRSAIAIENNMGVDIEAAVMDASRAAAVWHRRIPVACCSSLPLPLLHTDRLLLPGTRP